jgi:hypothetical protein
MLALASVLGLSSVAEAKKKRKKKRNKKKHTLRGAIGTDWTHVVGGGGSILFYNARTGAGLAGTLDGRGFTPVEEYNDFAKGYEVVVGTPRGSVLFLRNARLYEAYGLAAAGTLLNGRWTFLNQYRDFAPWTDAAASTDSLFLYNRTEALGASGTLVDGAWTYVKEYRNFYPDYTHFAASDDSLLFYRYNSGASAKAGTLQNGVWTFANSYEQSDDAWPFNHQVAVGAGDTLLFLKHQHDDADGFVGRLSNGAWQFAHMYIDFAPWTHAAHAGNGFVLLYRMADGLAAWGTLGGGEWEYYGTT